MRRSLRLAAATAALCLVFPVSAVSATTPVNIQFVVDTEFSDPGTPTFGPFVASGPAVDAGIVCQTGTTLDVFGKPAGFASQTGINLLVVKQFTCDDGSGTFLVKLQVRIDFRGDNFVWTVMGGTGAYERLHGRGSGSGFYPDEVSVIDTYTGAVHVD